MKFWTHTASIYLLFTLLLLRSAHGEAMVQYFNTSYAELMNKVPELAEVGYNSIWLPPPTKGSGGLSVGYDLWDRFDLGGKDQRGTVRTRYGTEEELLRLVALCHRFNLRVYFDNIMNHNAFDIPGFNESTPIDIYPGFIAAEDFHLRRTADGFYRKWDNTRDWNDAWQVQYLGLSDLIDIAQEAFINGNHGEFEGANFPKFVGLRHPDNPEYYAFDKDGNYVGFYSPTIASQMLTHPDAFHEDVNALLIRAARWLIDFTKADGLRLDAVKHVPDYFFGQQHGSGKDSSNAGYLGGVQEQFNITRGFSDWDNHRDSVFNTEAPRDDAMVFGEHLGQPPGYQGYIDAGMRLIDNDLRSELNNRLGNPNAGINGLDNPGWGGFSESVAVMHAQSHDNDFAARRELQHATYFTRTGLPLVYTDGNYHAETLGESGGAFPRHANTAFLGQFGDNRLPNIVYIHNHFARGSQASSFSDADYIAYERLDYREGHGSTTEQAVLLFMMNDNFANGLSRPLFTRFPANGGTSNDAYLYNYSTYAGGFYTYASNLGNIIVPPGGYFAFSYKNPDPAPMWQTAGGSVITITENGQPVTETLTYLRKDGPDGDPGYNPYGLPDNDPTDFAYAHTVPRVTDPGNLGFEVRTDGSSANTLLRLDGGMQLNSQNHALGDPRDNPPALSTDVFLGFEQMSFVHRQHLEKFAAEDTSNRNINGSFGAETWTVEIGTAGFTRNAAPTGSYTTAFTAQWVYHDPTNAQAPTNSLQFIPAPENAANSPIDVWVKIGVLQPSDINKTFLYYTTDGTAPEGAGGTGIATTKTVEMFYQQALDGGDWWKGTFPALTSGTTLRYKIGVFNNDLSIGEVFPSSAGNVELKQRMMSVFKLDNFDASTVTYRPHNDYGDTSTGLEEGFHILSARTFINRSGGSPFPGASIYNTFHQTFYLDATPPDGEIKFPAENDILGGQEYGVVVRTDPTVTAVYFNIEDTNPNNDDGVTTRPYGNGLITNTTPAWVEATQSTSSLAINSPYPLEWRFRYRNIPSSGAATIRVRLLERSSSTNMALTAVTGHWTELERNVTANGPTNRFFFDWPQVDGTEVGADFETRVLFESTLGDGFNDQELIDSFTFEIRADGDNNGTFQPKSAFRVQRFIGNGLGQLAYDLPDLYNPDAPNRLYDLIVTQTSPGGVISTTSVKVKALPIPPQPFIDIIEPEEVDVVGNRQDIEVTGFPTNQRVRVATDEMASNVFVRVEGEIIPFTDGPITGNTDRLWWDFDWVIVDEGLYRIEACMDTDGNTNTLEACDEIEIRVTLVERVSDNPSDLDDDDDGLLDLDEQTNPGPPPSANSDTWTNAQVHNERSLGRTDYLGPDSDRDGLPDGLELGYRTPGNWAATDATTDTDMDGFPNFRPDLDPPFYNTLDNFGIVPDVTSQSAGGDRRTQVQGTVTDANNPDSDFDGIPDGIEDWNRNGWVDGDGAAIPTNFTPWLERDWPDGELEPGDIWTETDPNNSDTDGDRSSDGTEDSDFNGWIAGDANSNRIYEASEAWTETNPLDPDTDHDGLPDGWERQYQFNPLDNGIDDLGTAMNTNDGQIVNGPDGNPDGDFIVVSGVTNAYTNIQEFNNGTNPREADIEGEPPEGRIVIGPGPMLGTVNGLVFNQEFLDWTEDDLIVLDEYEGDGSNHSSGDVYIANDGFDSSRDMVAFYARDGGSADGKFYFRVDFHDLQPFAEEGNLDIYVVINFNQPGNGEATLPDDVDTLTDLGWQAVVAVYDSISGRVYTDTDPTNNSSNFGEDLTAFGVEARDQDHPAGFVRAYYNSELDAVEFSIDREALTLPDFPNAGWSGINADDLLFQVFTTKDGTTNDPRGDGDIGGRTDIRDTIYDDFLADDYWRAQQGLTSRLTTNGCFGKNAANDRGKRAKIGMIVHGNQLIKPGNVIQDLINDGAGAGYHRVPKIHDIFQRPVNLHITPTLASALQWAKTDPTTTNAYRLSKFADGPLFNDFIGELAANGIVGLLGSTFSDHMMPYFPQEYNADNIDLATEFLTGIYGTSPSDRVLWLPERLGDSATLAQINALGYSHTIIDQMRHIWKWFGRSDALTQAGYRINRIENTDCFVINDFASTFLFNAHDNGLAFNLRNLAGKRARSSTQDQVLVLFSRWEEFGDNNKADAYDLSIRWIANRPWAQLLSLHDIATDAIDLSQPPDGEGDTWGREDRGTSLGLPKVAQDFIDHATMENYDRWYFGGTGPDEESLANKRFQVTPGVPVPNSFGLVATGGIMQVSWNAVDGLNGELRKLAGTCLHASVFQTGFHNQSNNDRSTFSTGDYIYPDSGDETLASFASVAHAQARHASLFSEVEDWSNIFTAPASATIKDIDQDGRMEYLLKGLHIMAVLEATGGRLTHLWIRDGEGGIVQVIGNDASFSGSETEHEGTTNIDSGNSELVGAYRTSALKDWFAADVGGGSSQYINQEYTVTAAPAPLIGFTFTSNDGKIRKTITVDDLNTHLQVDYTVDGSIQNLYIRNGLSPHLSDLLINGQNHLSPLATANDFVGLANTNVFNPVTVGFALGTNAQYNASALDDEPDDPNTDFETVPLRNQAQTQQVELFGNGSFSFNLFAANGLIDTDTDGIPDVVENEYNFLDPGTQPDALQDEDNDGASNFAEYIAGTNLADPTSRPGIDSIELEPSFNQFKVEFPTVIGREYILWYKNYGIDGSESIWTQVNATPWAGTGETFTWFDNGSQTTPGPDESALSYRLYRVEIRLP